MKRELIENVRVTPYTSGTAFDREGFLSGVLGVLIGTPSGSPETMQAKVVLTECDTEDGTFTVCKDKLIPVGKGILKRVVESDCKSRFLIRTETVVISDPSKGVSNGIELTPENGLLLSESDTDETVLAVGTNSQKSSSAKSEEGKYVTREMLLNYHVGPAEQVQVKSRDLNGKYIVVKGKHVGSPRGNWKTTVQMKPL